MSATPRAERSASVSHTALDGVRIAVTRAEGRGGALAEALRDVGAAVVELPLTRIDTLPTAPIDAALVRLDEYEWVLLTSANAVQHLSDALTRAGLALREQKIAVVGSATASAAESHGWRATLVPARFLAEGLVDAMAARGDVEHARMLYPSAEGARDVLPSGLEALGAIVDVVPVYRSAPDPEGQRRLRALVAEGALDLVTVAAPSAVDALLAALPPEHARRLPVACIGPVTARAARTAGFPVKVESESASVPSFVRSIIAAFSSSRPTSEHSA